MTVIVEQCIGKKGTKGVKRHNSLKKIKKFTLYQTEPASDSAAASVDNHIHSSSNPTRSDYHRKVARNSHLAARGVTRVDDDNVYSLSLSSYFDSNAHRPHYPPLLSEGVLVDGGAWARRRN